MVKRHFQQNIRNMFNLQTLSRHLRAVQWQCILLYLQLNIIMHATSKGLRCLQLSIFAFQK